MLRAFSEDGPAAVNVYPTLTSRPRTYSKQQSLCSSEGLSRDEPLKVECGRREKLDSAAHQADVDEEDCLNGVMSRITIGINNGPVVVWCSWIPKTPVCLMLLPLYGEFLQ